MKRRFTSLIIALVVGALTGVYGAPISPEQAMGRIGKAGLGQRTATASMQLVYTDQVSETPAYYVFASPANRNGGYVLASADNLAAPVLGYTDEGTFVYDSLPPQMKWWLDQYAAQIEWLRGRKAISPDRVISNGRPERQPIESMVHARWNQDAPYNDLCPTYSNGKTYVGCVATAMAQILRYWEYPTKGKGSHSYTYKNVTNSFDFENTEFLWNKMPFIHTSNWSNDNNLAVATISRACGVAVNMQYGVDGSGAYSSDVTPALITYFDYAPSTMHRDRDYFGLYEWEDSVYNSLARGCPVYYSGQGENGGHAFVVDGYQGDGYFHLNWGWAGASDGYFLLTALDPPTLGIGGGGGGFNWSQGAILNLRPNFPGSKNIPYIQSNAYTLSLSDNSLTHAGGAYNKSNETIPLVYFGFTFTNEAGEEWYSHPSYTTNLSTGWGYNSYSRAIPTLPAGTYYVNPSFKATDPTTGALKVYPMGQPANMKNSYTLNVAADGTYTLNKFSTQEINVTNFQVTSELYENSYFRLKATMKNPNPTEIYKELYVGWFDESYKYLGYSGILMTDIPANETLEYEKALEVPTSAGNYYLALSAEDPNNPGTAYTITDLIPVTIKSAQSGVMLRADNFTIRNSASVYASDIHMSVDLVGLSGYFSKPLYTFIFENNNQLLYHLTPVQFVAEGETQHLDFNFPFDAGEQNHTYNLTLAYPTNSGIQGLIGKNFTVGTTGVQIIEDNESDFKLTNFGTVVLATAPESVTSAQLYNLQGQQQTAELSIDANQVSVGMQSLPKGVYLLRVNTASASHTFRVLRP